MQNVSFFFFSKKKQLPKQKMDDVRYVEGFSYANKQQ